MLNYESGEIDVKLLCQASPAKRNQTKGLVGFQSVNNPLTQWAGWPVLMRRKQEDKNINKDRLMQSSEIIISCRRIKAILRPAEKYGKITNFKA